MLAMVCTAPVTCACDQRVCCVSGCAELLLLFDVTVATNTTRCGIDTRRYKNPFSETNLKEQKLEHMRKQKAEQKAEDRLEKKQTRGPSLSQLRSEF